jgi:hypothetical protein
MMPAYPKNHHQSRLRHHVLLQEAEQREPRGPDVVVRHVLLRRVADAPAAPHEQHPHLGQPRHRHRVVPRTAHQHRRRLGRGAAAPGRPRRALQLRGQLRVAGRRRRRVLTRASTRSSGINRLGFLYVRHHFSVPQLVLVVHQVRSPYAPRRNRPACPRISGRRVSRSSSRSSPSPCRPWRGCPP